jgi:UDP-glucuronate decarboxylase
MAMKIIVTGGAGFLGSHLCERLLADGHDIVCVDNLHTGRRENIAHLADEGRFAFVRHDVSEPLDIAADLIYNLACPASPAHYQADPVRTIRTSVLGALNLLELARRTRARLVQASTSEVYGSPHVHPQSEIYWGHVNPVGVRACYDEGKRCAETLCSDYRRQYGVATKLARIFNTYGPRMQPDDGRVVSNFIVQALDGRPLTVYGEGAQTRSFCYVTDLVDGLARLAEAPDSFAGPVNLGNPNECTVRELALLVLQMTGSKSRIVYERLPQDDPVRRCPDITTAKRVLHWAPRVPLRQGLQRTIAYFKARATPASALRGEPARAMSTGL